MSPERRRTAQDRREARRVPAVFAVKKSLAGAIQLCQAEDIALAGITIRRPRGVSVQPRTEIGLEFALPGTDQEIAARGVVVNDSLAGSFRRTGIRFIALRPEHARLIAGYCRTEPSRSRDRAR
jgi:c-di-GMP-binding flagellar brake protein YcgR